MRILSMHVRFFPAVLAGTKTTTIRKEIHPDRFYQLWSPGPRTGKGIHRGTVEILSIENIEGKNFTDHHAIHDGFRNARALRTELGKLNSMLIIEVMEHRWHILEFRFTRDFQPSHAIPGPISPGPVLEDGPSSSGSD